MKTVSFTQRQQCRKRLVILRQGGEYVDKKAHPASNRKSEVGYVTDGGRNRPQDSKVSLEVAAKICKERDKIGGASFADVCRKTRIFCHWFVTHQNSENGQFCLKCLLSTL